MTIINPFKYPELTTFILQYLPTKQIVNLYCNSKTISTGILLSSYVMNADIFYNPTANYNNFPTHQFVACINKYMKDEEFLKHKATQLSKFANIKFVCNLLGHYCTTNHFSTQSCFTVNKRIINFLKHFELIDPCYYLNYDCDIFNEFYRYL